MNEYLPKHVIKQVKSSMAVLYAYANVLQIDALWVFIELPMIVLLGSIGGFS